MSPDPVCVSVFVGTETTAEEVLNVNNLSRLNNVAAGKLIVPPL